MGSICFFPKCVPKSRDFVVFPFNRSQEFENWWIKSGWVNAIPLKKLPSKILICEEHFEKDLINRRFKVPRLALGALPTRNIECPVQKPPAPREDSAQSNAAYKHRKSYCRLCGQAQITHVSDEPELLLQLDDIFQYQLHLSESTTLPVSVCFSCKEKASEMLTFWKQCTEAQKILKTIYGKEHAAKLSNSAETSSETKYFPTKLTEANYLPSSKLSDSVENDLPTKKETLPSEYEEIEIDTSAQITEEQFANEYEFETYGEELPASTADECEEVIELAEPQSELISDDYTIEYADESSSQSAVANQSTDQEEYHRPAKKGAAPAKETKHICEVCGNSFKTLNGLRAHLLGHSERRDFQCNICGHEFKQRRGLVEHVESKHERRTFSCKICGMPYSWKKGLQRHMNTHKGTAMKHECKVCGKAFPVPHKLKLHMMLHTGDRIHCEFCGKGYRFNYMLTQHKIRVHNMVIEGVKLYSTPKQKKLADRKK